MQDEVPPNTRKESITCCGHSMLVWEKHILICFSFVLRFLYSVCSSMKCVKIVMLFHEQLTNTISASPLLTKWKQQYFSSRLSWIHIFIMPCWPMVNTCSHISDQITTEVGVLLIIVIVQRHFKNSHCRMTTS